MERVAEEAYKNPLSDQSLLKKVFEKQVQFEKSCNRWGIFNKNGGQAEVKAAKFALENAKYTTNAWSVAEILDRTALKGKQAENLHALTEELRRTVPGPYPSGDRRSIPEDPDAALNARYPVGSELVEPSEAIRRLKRDRTKVASEVYAASASPASGRTGEAPIDLPPADNNVVTRAPVASQAGAQPAAAADSRDQWAILAARALAICPSPNGPDLYRGAGPKSRAR